MPYISVVMPVYNNEKYFPLAVQSVLEQDDSDFELIIVDDGSTDDTSALADQIAASDQRVKVIHQHNQWIYASFNNGVRAACGEYIYILNSDDKIRPGSLALMERTARRYQPDVIWTKVLAHRCGPDQEILRYDTDGLDEKVSEEMYFGDTASVRRAWPYFVSSVLAHNQANLYRRKLVLRHPFRNDVYGADVLFNIAIAPDVRSAYVLKEVVYDHFIYGREEMNASVNKYYPYEHGMFHEIFTQYNELFRKWDIPEQAYLDMICGRRFTQFAGELRALLSAKCPLSAEEKLKRIYLEYADELTGRCAAVLNRTEEYESRILSLTREILFREGLSADSGMYFLTGLLDGLLCYEKDGQDYQKIKEALNHPNNPSHIGKTFYEKLIRGKKKEEDISV